MDDDNGKAISILRGTRVQNIDFCVGLFTVDKNWFTFIADAINRLDVRVYLSAKGDQQTAITRPRRSFNSITCDITLPVGDGWNDLQTQGLLIHETIHAGFYLVERTEGRVGIPPPGFGGLGVRGRTLPQIPSTEEEALAYLAQAFFLCSDEIELEDAQAVRRTQDLAGVYNPVELAKWTLAELIEGKAHHLHLKRRHFIPAGHFHRLAQRLNELSYY